MNELVWGAVLTAARGASVREPSAEAGYARLREVSGRDWPDATWAEAVAHCVATGLVRDPVRLEAGSLQCRWLLELTPAGVKAAGGGIRH